VNQIGRRVRLLPGILVVLLGVAALSACAQTPYVAFDGVVLPATRLSTDSAHLLVFGDWGDGSAEQKSVAAAMKQRESAHPFDFAVLLGDNFYENGVTGVSDPQFETKFQEIYPASDFPFPFYVVLGNHDHRRNAQAQYRYDDPAGRWTAPDIGYILPLVLADGYRVDLYFLDSEVLARQDGVADGLADWVKARLQNSSADVTIVATHRPFYSSGRHGNTDFLLSYFSTELNSGKIDMTLSGHDHDLELQRRGNSAKNTLFVVSGSAARTRPISAGPKTLFASSSYGFAELDLSATATHVTFFDQTGTRLYRY